MNRSRRILHGQSRQPFEWNYFPLLTERIKLSNKKRNLRKYSVVFFFKAFSKKNKLFCGPCISRNVYFFLLLLLLLLFWIHKQKTIEIKIMTTQLWRRRLIEKGNHSVQQQQQQLLLLLILFLMSANRLFKFLNQGNKSI